MPVRLGIAGLSHETNTFVQGVTDLAAFAAQGIYRRQEMTQLAGTNTVIGGALDAIAGTAGQIQAVPLVTASAIPGGIVTADAFETIVGDIRAELTQQPLDALLLDLHGAMVTETTDDGEGAILRQVRDVVGPDLPVIAVLDWHTHLTPEMVNLTDLLLPYDTYPHVDPAERGAEAVALLARLAAGDIRPVTAWQRLPLLTPSCVQASELEPMRSIVARAHELEQQPGILNVGIMPGFAYADVPIAGFAVTVTANGDASLAHRTASMLADEIWGRREAFRPDVRSVEAAVHAAMLSERGPVVLADQGDNPGGGTPADGTALLWGLLDLGARRAALAIIADPEAVDRAFAAGRDAELSLELGGKTDEWHGYPITVQARVRALSDGRFTYEGPMHRGAPGHLGRTAVLACRGRYDNEVEVIVTERRVQPYDTAIFRSQGIEPTAKQILAVKSAVHFRGSFSPLASQIIAVDTPGLTAVDLGRLPYRRRPQPVWPYEEIASWRAAPVVAGARDMRR